MRRKVFISYSTADQRIIKELHAKLSPHHDIWYDDELHKTIGQNWWDTILDEIAKANIFILLISRESLESIYCQGELKEARRLRKPIVPLIVRSKVQIPADLSTIQTLDISSGVSDENVAKLVASLEKIHVPDPPPSPTHLQRAKLPKPGNKFVLVAILIAIILIILFIGAALMQFDEDYANPTLIGVTDTETTTVTTIETSTHPPQPTNTSENTAIPTTAIIESTSESLRTTSTVPPTQSEALSLPSTTITKVYPCLAQIIFTTGASLNQVHIDPSRDAPMSPLVKQGIDIFILTEHRNEDIIWYQISYFSSTGEEADGWIPIEYVVPSESCPD